MSEEQTTTPDADQESGQGGPSVWTVLSGVILGSILLVAVWLVVTPGPRDGATDDPAPGDGDEEPASVGAGEGGCPEMPEGDDIPTTPPEVEWRLEYTVALPYDADHGPAVVDGDVARCFSRTPIGALIAARQIAARLVASPAGAEVVQTQTIPGPGQDAVLNSLLERGPATPRPGDLCQTAGFQVLSWDPSRAVFSIATRCANGSLQLTQVTVVWADGDWRIELPETGTTARSALRDLSGLIPWGGM